MNIGEVEPKLANELSAPLRGILRGLGISIPDNYRPLVSLMAANGRKKRSNAAANNWSPESGDGIQICFQPAEEENQHEENTAPGRMQKEASEYAAPGPLAMSVTTYVHPAEAELLKALDRAESRPGWNFVPLKKFRDEILPMEHCPSMRTDVEQRTMLRSVIDKKFVLVSRVANPKAPQFPVTTIRLNRLLPEVRAVLGQSGSADLDFRPVEIRGEPLSATILRERR